MSDLIEMGSLNALETYLKTSASTGLLLDEKENVKEFELNKVRSVFGKNQFRPLNLTSISTTVQIMLGDISLQFLLIAALVATILEMTQEGWATGISEGLAIFNIVILIFVAKYYIQNQLEKRLAQLV